MLYSSTLLFSGQTHNFAKYTDGRLHHLGESYDYDSIMHYGSYDFTKFRNRPTILPKQRNVFIGQRNGFSRTDVRKINKLYQCNTATRGTELSQYSRYTYTR